MGTLPRQTLGHCRFMGREVSFFFSLLTRERETGVRRRQCRGVPSSEWH